MRKVYYNEWIPIQRDDKQKVILGTGRWEKGFPNAGLFHQWAVNHEEYDTGVGNFTVALIEREDGTITEIFPSEVKFAETKFTIVK